LCGSTAKGAQGRDETLEVQQLPEAMMLTVAEAARRSDKSPETIRRWIREGRLRAVRVGTHHVIDEADLEPLLEDAVLPVPPEWTRMSDGRLVPNVVRAVRLSRAGR
jgi:excisionase family DNA binding protein